MCLWHRVMTFLCNQWLVSSMTNVLIKTTETVKHWSTFFFFYLFTFFLFRCLTVTRRPSIPGMPTYPRRGSSANLCKLGREEQNRPISHVLWLIFEAHEKGWASQTPKQLGCSGTRWDMSRRERRRNPLRNCLRWSQTRASACPLPPSRCSGPCQPGAMGEPLVPLLPALLDHCRLVQCPYSPQTAIRTPVRTLSTRRRLAVRSFCPTTRWASDGISEGSEPPQLVGIGCCVADNLGAPRTPTE